MTERKTFLRGILGTGGLGGCLRRRLGSAIPEYYTVLPQLKDLALSDNGTEFKNELFTTVAKKLGVEHKIYSPPFHPQSNG